MQLHIILEATVNYSMFPSKGFWQSKLFVLSDVRTLQRPEL